jgi:hypothetical protein
MKKLWSVSCLFCLRQHAADHYLSPRTNINLLQRSEVVALINTLFRFSESLVCCGGFQADVASA